VKIRRRKMHLTRPETSKKLPIARKGTIYVARPASHLHSSVTVVAAIRDMLKLARTSQEVKEMIKKKYIKVNGRTVRSLKENIKLFNVLEADKHYLKQADTILKKLKTKLELPRLLVKRFWERILCRLIFMMVQTPYLRIR
jgi:ribosomal protein S4E